MDKMKTLKLLNEKISIELTVVSDKKHRERLEDLLRRIQDTQMMNSFGGDLGNIFGRKYDD